VNSQKGSSRREAMNLCFDRNDISHHQMGGLCDLVALSEDSKDATGVEGKFIRVKKPLTATLGQ
jgi:hypothetical protein